jgi:hypothetical protein
VALSEPPTPRDAQPPMFDYRQLVIDSDIPKALRKNATGPIEISTLRPSTGSQPGDWMTCVRGWQSGRLVALAVFFKNNVIVDRRGGVMIDECDKDSFSPLMPYIGPY